jgi:multicomponent Na+:H+ antiporter subunit A
VIALLVLYAVVGTVLIAVGARLGRGAFLLGALAPATTIGWIVFRFNDVVDGLVASDRVAWVPELDLWLDLRLDGFATTMTLIVAVVGVLVFAYAAAYFTAATPDLGRLAGLMVLFAGAMVGLVLADQLIILYVFWEITAVTSYLLIGTNYADANARAAALHALLVTVAGGLAMLGGFVIVGQAGGTYRLSALASAPGLTGTAVTVALVLVLIGAFTKSAQYPFHAWLPGAMAAPTPISAYLHSATMVVAGVYLVARLTPVFANVTVWRPMVLTVGIVSLVAGGIRALHQHDLKRLLAFGTVSQLGLMMVLFGSGTPAAATAGWVLLVAHAAFKAALFMVVGILDQQTGTRDIRTLPPLRRGWWWVEALALVSAISMAGIPLGLGFVAKESAYEALLHAPYAGADLVLAAVVAGSMLTVAYSVRFYLGAFVVPRRRARAAGMPVDSASYAPSWAFVAPAAILAAVGMVFGVAPGLEDPLATVGIPGYPAISVHLELWHGWNLALALSAVTLAGGAAIAAFDPSVQRLLALGRSVPSAQRAYLGLLRGVGEGSRRITGVVQNGSLPVYAGVILATAAILPVVAAASSWEWAKWPAIIGPVANIPIAALLVVAALGAARVRRRFSAALLLGAVGYAMAALFVSVGAPDLALTQAAIETLSTVLFVLVLRRLPPRFERQSTGRRRALRLAIAAMVGAGVFVFAIAASGTRITPPTSDEIVARAVPDGGGRNVVNVILVDFRSLDTLGEITVLVAASIGAVALARVGRRVAAERGESKVPSVAPVNRVVFVDVSAQLVFHAVLMASLWLLFAGHNQPGGGFVAGLLAGSAIALRYIAGGIAEVRSLSRFRPWTVLGVGLLIAAATAAAPLLSGNPVLDVATATLHLPVAGTVKLSSALIFDVGVYITVIGMVLMVFEAFGDEPFGDEPSATTS